MRGVTLANPSGKPMMPKFELKLPDNTTASDTSDDPDAIHLLEKLKQAKQLIEENREKKRKREILEETLHEFNRDANITRDKYGKLITEKKKKLLQEGTKLVQMNQKEIERLDVIISNAEVFLKTQQTRIQDAEKLIQHFEQRMRGETAQVDQTIEGELTTMQMQVKDKLLETHRALQKATKKTKKRDNIMLILHTLLQDLNA